MQKHTVHSLQTYGFAPLRMVSKAIRVTEFLLTNVTRQPSTFVVRPQKMGLEMRGPDKTGGTVTARMRLRNSVNIHVSLEVAICLAFHFAVRTLVRSLVAVYTMFMLPQAARLPEAFVTQRTHMRFVFRVDSHVSFQISGLTESFVAQLTFVQFLSTVNSAVHYQVRRRRKSLATHWTFERFLAGMTSFVSCQVMTVAITFAAFCASVFTSVNMRMLMYAILS